MNSDINPDQLSNSETADRKLEAFFGLPSDVKYCKHCVVSNQRPVSALEFKHVKNTAKKTIHFDTDNVCDACHVAEEKKKIDWEERDKELNELCDKHRRSDGRYDCIVPGSGGKDSFYASHILKYKYNMNPLTVTWAPHIYTDWGWRNFQSWIHSGFDNILLTANGRTHRLLTRLATENLFHPFQPFILGQKAIAPKYSVMYDVPLVFYGESETEYGNPKQGHKQAQQDWAYFTGGNENEINIGGVSIADLKSEFGISPNELEIYMPADPDQLKKNKTEVHYLGYYLEWHPQNCFYYAVENGNFLPSPERTPGTYGKYASIDDKVDDFHFYTTFIKFGIGHATYDAAQEIRNGDITRDEGIALIEKYDGEFPERFADEVFEYLSINETQFPKAAHNLKNSTMTRDYFHELTDSFRSPHLWEQENEKWKLRSPIWK
jgi:N-acetyl sugar amidotransferase